jgi:predicted ATP-grasp superfamily ATP-dependent carboligase
MESSVRIAARVLETRRAPARRGAARAAGPPAAVAPGAGGHQTPAIVLGDGPSALGALRCLGREGVPTYHAACGGDFARRSRWARPLAPPLAAFATPAELAAYLERLPFERAVLIPCSDALARAVAGLDARVAERFRASVAPAERLETFVDKRRFARFVEAAGLPHPRTIAVGARADLERLPDERFAAAFLKPCDSQAFSARFAAKAFRVRSRAEALAAFERAERAGLEVLLQEYVPGPPDGHYYVDAFVDGAGRTLARFARRRLRMDAPFANSSYLRSLPPDQARGAIAVMDRLVAALAPVRGILSAEFKLDPRDGEFRLIEVNARAWKHIEFAATSGVNICKLAYDDALGVRNEPVASYDGGAFCADRYHDLRPCLELYRRGELSLGGWARSWLAAKGPVASADDPLPALAYFGELVTGAARRRFGRDGARAG